MKAGTFNVEVAQEAILWCDTKRWVPFGCPCSFTKYEVTESRLIIKSGLLTRTEEEIKLYRIADITHTQSLLERMCGVGTLRIRSSDTSAPDVKLVHIKEAGKVRDLLQQYVEKARKNAGVNTAELVGNSFGDF